MLADGASPCDLLHEVPFRRFDVEATVRALGFAFSSGDVGDAFVRLLDRAELAASGFAPADFAEDVFLPELVRRKEKSCSSWCSSCSASCDRGPS